LSVAAMAKTTLKSILQVNSDVAVASAAPPPPHTRTQNQPRPSGFLLHAIALHICTGIDESSQYMFDSPGSEELEAGQEICLLLCSSMPVLA